MSRRKDQERFTRLKEQNPDYVGFRGPNTTPARPAVALETVDCSVCQRKRNVPSDTIPADRSSFVCLSCQEEQQTASAPSAEGETVPPGS